MEDLAAQPPATCERCGNFAALGPWHGRALCTACRERRHAAELEPYSIAGLIRASVLVVAGLGLGAFAAFAGLRSVYYALDSVSDGFGKAGALADTLFDLTLGGLISAAVRALVVLAAVAMIGSLGMPAYRAAFDQLRRRAWVFVGTTLVCDLIVVVIGALTSFTGWELLGPLDHPVLVRQLLSLYATTLLMLAMPVALLEGTGVWHSIGSSIRRVLPRSGTIFVVVLLFKAPGRLTNHVAGRLEEWLPTAGPSALQALGGVSVVCWILLAAAAGVLEAALGAVVYLRSRDPAARA